MQPACQARLQECTLFLSRLRWPPLVQGRLTAREDEKFRLSFVAGEKEKKYNGISVIESVEDLFPENSLSSLVHRWCLSIYHQSVYLSIWHLSNLYLSIIYHHYHHHLPSLIAMSPYITPFKAKVRAGNSLHPVMCLPHPARLHSPPS